VSAEALADGPGRAALYPTRAAVVLMFAGAPLSLVVGVLAPSLWLVAAAWIALCGALILIDSIASPGGRRASVRVTAPATLSVNGAGVGRVEIAFAGRAPSAVEMALETTPNLAAEPPRATSRTQDGSAVGAFALTPRRRGAGALTQVWARWRGPLGLIWKQLALPTDTTIAVTPDIEGLRQEAVRLFAREATHGLKVLPEAGDGADFHALREFQAGMDIRSIDWKRSAAHGELLAKEYRAERNNPIILAIDAGRSMSEPLGSLARVDWALNAALLLAFVSLKIGDRVGLYHFAGRPARLSGPVSGVKAFTALQRAATQIDYSTEETNYTLGLANLAERLERRSLIVVFTEFTDSTTAQVMIETVGALLSRHLLLFVVMRDEELEDLVHAEPLAPEDVTRSVIAGELLREREIVVARLRRLGVEIIDAPARSIGPALLDRYLALKRRGRI
jgi:uncharacterized protein (DUF58 family)